MIAAARAAVDTLFGKAALRLGLTKMPSGARRISVSVDPKFTLPGLHIAAAKEFGFALRPRVVEHVRRIAFDYLAGQREAAKAAVTRTIDGILRGAGDKIHKPATRRKLGEALELITTKLSTAVERIAATEATAVRNLGLAEAIGQINAEAGIEDPVVFFIVVKDGQACKRECVRLHLMPDRVTPRLWLRSECENGYHTPNGPRPSLLGAHPNCRCALATLLVGYSFDEAGMVKYHSPGWKEIEKQRGVA